MTAHSPSLADLYQRLEPDRWRVEHSFSGDIPIANALLHNAAAYEDELSECLRRWCQDQQPCQFGRVAARDGRIHFCVLREPQIATWTDEEIIEAVANGKRLWKQRAAYDSARAAHSFVLVLASPRLAFAAPNAHLRAFADHALSLTGWVEQTSARRRGNSISSDYLYLRNPHDKQFYGFQFNVDFFACAGDRRWWHDHRFPGGIAFTANSTGHMRCYREWHDGARDAAEWAVRQAMITIRNAAPTAQFRTVSCTASAPNAVADDGRVTWLRPVDGQGRPFLTDVACPMAKVPKQLQGADWTRYEGYLHTDHAVREEFFLDREMPPTRTAPYLMDFTYLYDDQQLDFQDFTAGRIVTEAAIHAEIGDPSTWSHRTPASHPPRTHEEDVAVAEQLSACECWHSPAWFAPID